MDLTNLSVIAANAFPWHSVVMGRTTVIETKKIVISVTRSSVTVRITYLTNYILNVFTALSRLYQFLIWSISHILVPTEDGYKCIFPFIYNGKEHRRCTKAGNYNPWCAYSVNDKGEMHSGYWDYCKYDDD